MSDLLVFYIEPSSYVHNVSEVGNTSVVRRAKPWHLEEVNHWKSALGPRGLEPHRPRVVASRKPTMRGRGRNWLNRFLRYWRRNGHRDQRQAHIVAYADDLVILTRAGTAGDAMARLRSALPRLGLTVDETKTVTVDARSQQFDFLCYSFGAHDRRCNGKCCRGASPSKKSVQRLKANMRALLVSSNSGTGPETSDRLNRMLRGWAGYFGYGSRGLAYRAVDAKWRNARDTSCASGTR